MDSVNLDRHALLVDARDKIAAEIRDLQTALDELNAQIQREMGDAETALVAGKPVFTWRHTGQFNARRFTTEQPALAERYTHMVPALDQASIAKDHPELFTAYRARVFRRTGQ